MTDYFPPPGVIALAIIVACGTYVHFRGAVRHRFARQLSDHSTLLAPINCVSYLFSKLPSQPYHPVETFPELKVLKENWKIIRDEALALNEDNKICASDKHDDVGFNSFFRTGWKRFYLKWYGNELVSANELCPKTVALLNSISTIKAAMFTSLPPGAKLVQHRDPYAGSLRYHLALTAPGDDACAIYVDGQRYVWHDGEDVVFDETYIHHAENRTDKPRIVLFCDVVRPLWFPPARWFNAVFSRIVLGAAVSKNVEGDKVGFLNHVFGYFYKVRLVAKRLKQSQRKLYYFLKFTLIALLVYAIFLKAFVHDYVGI